MSRLPVLVVRYCSCFFVNSQYVLDERCNRIVVTGQFAMIGGGVAAPSTIVL